jgi:hypothetical protein
MSRTTSEAKEQPMVTHAGGEQTAATTQGGSAGLPATTRRVTHHGNSPAAWTMVLIVMLGALVAAVGVAIASIVLVVVGAVIVVIGLITGKVLSLAGYGTVKPTDPRAPHGVA